MTVVFPGRARVDALYRDFVIPTDQPTHAGGAGEAPAPFDYFLASLGTCAGFYVLRFLQRRNLPTDGVRLTVKTVNDREHGMLSDVEIRVILPEAIPEKYRNAILNAVGLCSVKRQLADPPRIRTLVEIGRRVVAEDPGEARPAPDGERQPGAAVSTEHET